VAKIKNRLSKPLAIFRNLGPLLLFGSKNLNQTITTRLTPPLTAISDRVDYKKTSHVPPASRRRQCEVTIANRAYRVGGWVKSVTFSLRCPADAVGYANC